MLELLVVPSELDQPDALVEALAKVEGVERVERVAVSPGLAAAGAAGSGMPNLPAGPCMPGGSPAGMAGGGSGPGEVRLRLYLSTDAPALLGPVMSALTERAASVSDVHIGRASLEDVFIELTGRGLR